MFNRYVLAVVVFCLLFIIPAVNAGSIELTAEKDNIAAVQGQSASIKLNLFSYHDDRIIMSIKDAKAWMSLSEVQPRLNASENKTLELRLQPGFNAKPGVYKIKIIAISQLTGDKSEVGMYISLRASTDVVSIDKITVDGSLKPFSDIVLVTSVKNGKSVTLHDLNIVLTLVNKNNTDIKTSFSSIKTIPFNSTIDTNFTMLLPKNLDAGLYRIHAELFESNKLLDDKYSPEFSIKSAPVFNRQESSAFGFIGMGKNIVIENVGNEAGTGEIEEDIGMLSLFYVGDAPQIKDKGVYKWSFVLEPSQTMTITYYINYLPVIIIALIFIGFLWYLFNYVFTVKILKKIMHQKKLEDGAQFTVGIEIRNETMNDIHDIVVRDFVPHVFTVEKQATIKPLKKKTPLGTELIWRLDTLKKGDARIISYKIRSRIGVSGHVRMASANIRYKYKRMRFLRESNIVVLGSGGETS